MKKKLFFITFFVLIFFNANSQIICYEDVRREDINSEYDANFRALNIPFIYPKIVLDNHYKPINNKNLFFRKLFYEHLIVLEDSNFNISIDPALDLRVGDENKNNIYTNTRGIIINGNIGKSLFICSEFYETQTKIPEYAANWVDSMNIIPGMINPKPIGNNSYDYGVVFGQLMWQATKNYGLRLGYDRFHIGKGYRSMILADAAQAYPFLMNSFAHKSLTFSHSIAMLHNPDYKKKIDIPHAESSVYQQKWLTFTNLTYSPNDWLNLGLFEAIVFLPADSIGKRFYPLSILPIPIVRNAIVETQKQHYAFTALQIEARFLKKYCIYSQFVVDKLMLNNIKYQQGFQGAFQLGALAYFKKNTFFFTEFNIATNNAYTGTQRWTAYTNIDQALAHPSGQQFYEIIAGAKWTYKRFFTNATVSAIKAGSLPYSYNCLRADNYLQDKTNGFFAPISIPDKALNIDYSISYIINPATAFNAFVQVHYRKNKSSFSVVPQNSLSVEFGIRHSIRKQYYDFF